MLIIYRDDCAYIYILLTILNLHKVVHLTLTYWKDFKELISHRRQRILNNEEGFEQLTFKLNHKTRSYFMLLRLISVISSVCFKIYISTVI